MKLGADDLLDFDRSSVRTWLEPDGRGGYASGSISGANTSREHGLLVVASRASRDRFNLVNQLDEVVEGAGAPWPLSTRLQGGALGPRGFVDCAEHSTWPNPSWRFRRGDVELVREIICPRAVPAVLIRWRLRAGAGARRLLLRVRPLLAARSGNALRRRFCRLQPSVAESPGTVQWRPAEELPPIRAFHPGQYRHDPAWYERVSYPLERDRGEDDAEDLWSPGEMVLELAEGQDAWLAFSSVLPADARIPGDAFEREQSRRSAFTARAGGRDPFFQTLWRSSEAFLCEDEALGPSVTAGFPYFRRWTRDTCAALPGLCLATGKLDFARRALEAFLPHLSEGMIPNLLPLPGESPTYASIDVSLWFILTIGRYLEAGGTLDSVRGGLWPAVKAILDGYRRGTRYGIRADDADGLVGGGAPDLHLTWMDATSDGQVVTPRTGKPVEVQAFWCAALKVGASLGRAFGEEAWARGCDEARARARGSFARRFWYEAGGYCHDVLDGPEGPDATLRPSQVWALVSDEPLLDPERARRALEVVERELLVPGAIRTLPRGDPRYHARYVGAQARRDAAYHQGTAWPFLLGPFGLAWLRVHGDTPESRRRVRELVRPLEEHLGEGCLDHLSEILDADPPHLPRGCFAQAWSVGEVLFLLTRIGSGPSPSW